MLWACVLSSHPPGCVPPSLRLGSYLCLLSYAQGQGQAKPGEAPASPALTPHATHQGGSKYLLVRVLEAGQLGEVM